MRKILRGGAGVDRWEKGERAPLHSHRQGGRWSAAGRCNARRRPGRRADSRTATPLRVGDHGAKSAFAAQWHVARPPRRSPAKYSRWRRADAPAVRLDADARAEIPSRAISTFNPSSVSLIPWRLKQALQPVCVDDSRRMEPGVRRFASRLDEIWMWVLVRRPPNNQCGVRPSATLYNSRTYAL